MHLTNVPASKVRICLVLPRLLVSSQTNALESCCFLFEHAQAARGGTIAA